MHEIPSSRPPSSSGSHILILTHETDQFNEHKYYMRGMTCLWQEMGFKVTVQSGVGRMIDADLVILHVDLTIMPEAYRQYVRQYPKVINGGVFDISKRAISRCRVRRGDGYSGPVIVKTDLNCRGLAERGVTRKAGGWRKLGHKIRHHLPWSWRSHLDAYRVFPSPRDVPWAVWFNPNLIVDQYRPERNGEEYVVRTWHFLGDQEVCYKTFSPHPVINPQNIVRREPISLESDDLRQRRVELGFDFGKFDYVVVDGETILFDVNPTPTSGSVEPDKLAYRFKIVAQGIQSYLPMPSPAALARSLDL